MALAALLGLSAGASEPEYGRAVLTDSRNPPLLTFLHPADPASTDLGHAIFNTQFTAATEQPSRRDGVGPLFNAAACDACHNEGAHARGPVGDGLLPAGLVIELSGDPTYGRTFNTLAVDGLRPEGQVAVRYRERVVRYPDGTARRLRVPAYEFTEMSQGPLAPETVIEPRLAPALFGVGLLEALPVSGGRFGWQNTALDVRDQTAQALSRDMGLTSHALPHDDCMPVQRECLQARNGGAPEVSDEFLDALVTFQSALAVPSPPNPVTGQAADAERRFGQLGCGACHVARQHIERGGERRLIRPFSDLQRHAMGEGLDDRRVDGSRVPSAFRTAPLWGMGYRVGMEQFPTFLHDGRARSLEEAILWHDGEAATAARAFMQLPGTEREALIRWLSSQ